VAGVPGGVQGVVRVESGKANLVEDTMPPYRMIGIALKSVWKHTAAELSSFCAPHDE